MKTRKIVTDENRSEILAKLAFSDLKSWGEVFDRLKGKCSEKDIGLMMIQKIKERFDLTDAEIKDMLVDFLKKEADEQRGIKDDRTVKWTRDEKGRIISPFSKKKAEDRI